MRPHQAHRWSVSSWRGTTTTIWTSYAARWKERP